VKKVYRVWVKRLPQRSKLSGILDEMRRGIVDDGDSLRAISSRFEEKSGYIEVTLAEGKKHEIKRLFYHFDLKVTQLVRVAIGPVKLGGLRPGEMARLSERKMNEVLAFTQARLSGDL